LTADVITPVVSNEFTPVVSNKHILHFFTTCVRNESIEVQCNLTKCIRSVFTSGSWLYSSADQNDMRGNGWSRSGEGFTKTEHSHFQRLYLHSSPAESYVPLKDFRPIILSLNFHSRCCYEGQASHRSSRGL